MRLDKPTHRQKEERPSTASTAAPAGVRLVDDFAKAEIQFVSTDVQIHDEALFTVVRGLCGRQHNGARLTWSVSASELKGIATCQSGQFGVHLSQLDDMVCGVEHLLVVDADWGASTFTRVFRRCQPLATELIVAPEGSPGGTQCALEYNPDGEAAATCAKSCYRDDKLVFAIPVELEQCSGLVTQLAGP